MDTNTEGSCVSLVIMSLERYSRRLNFLFLSTCVQLHGCRCRGGNVDLSRFRFSQMTLRRGEKVKSELKLV